TLEAALPLAPDVPPEIAHELTAMHFFSDEALWAATAPSLSPTEETRLTQLNSAATERALTGAEQAEQHSLMAAYHRSVLRRAKALALLAQRGLAAAHTGEQYGPWRTLTSQNPCGRQCVNGPEDAANIA